MRDLQAISYPGGMLEKTDFYQCAGNNSMLDAAGRFACQDRWKNGAAAGCDAAAGVDVEAIPEVLSVESRFRKWVGMARLAGIARS